MSEFSKLRVWNNDAPSSNTEKPRGEGVVSSFLQGDKSMLSGLPTAFTTGNDATLDLWSALWLRSSHCTLKLWIKIIWYKKKGIHNLFFFSEEVLKHVYIITVYQSLNKMIWPNR